MAKKRKTKLKRRAEAAKAPWYAHLFEGVSGQSLAAFRIAFGLVMLWEVVRYFNYGWIARYWMEPEFNFSYPLLGWLTPWPGNGMVIHFYVLAFLALLITVGLFYRVSAVLFFFAFAYMFFLDEARYLNHFYLMLLFSFLLIFIPAQRSFSLDARFRKLEPEVPLWAVWLLRFQVGVPYFFGGIAKLNGDWLRGEPLARWLEHPTVQLPAFITGQPWSGTLFAYGGLLLDLLAFPLLLWRPARPFIFAALALFHLTNDRLFEIGIFPWVMVLATSLFFAPDWPRQLYTTLRGSARAALIIGLSALLMGGFALWIYGGFSVVPLLAGLLAGALISWDGFRLLTKTMPSKQRPHGGFVPGRAPLLMALLGLWVLFQVLVPLRHFAIPGMVHWTEEGHRFAWHMKLRDKQGSLLYYAYDPDTGLSTEIDPRSRLPSWQYNSLIARPFMMQQYARRLQQEFAEEGLEHLEIRASALASLNGRRYQNLVDPNVDLSRATLRLHNDWILPLEQPLRAARSP